VARFYVTTPIYYVNDAPHIGHAYTTITADALARWHRLTGDDVWFLTGTDEHGLKVQRAAESNSLSPIEHADRFSRRYSEVWASLDISNDDFIRTTEDRHHRATQQLMQAAYERGWIDLRPYEGLYCVSCEAYYTETELIDGRLCPIHRTPVEWLKEENYFFKLSEFTEPLLKWYESEPGAVTPESKRNEAVGLIRGGLRDISISRTSITWGVPVPWDEKHVFYVWYDALINYATAVGYGSDASRFAQWWPAVHHLIGKDILRFHCVYWPALLMAAGIDPPHRIAVHGFLLVGGEKMSKTCSRLSASTATGITSFATRLSVRTVTFPTKVWSPATTPIWLTTSATCSRVFRRSLSANAQGSVPHRPRRLRWHRLSPRLCPRLQRPGRVSPRATRSKRPGDSSTKLTPLSKRRNRGRQSRDLRSTRCSATPSKSCGSWPSFPAPL
jgi:hypothetical protein